MSVTDSYIVERVQSKLSGWRGNLLTAPDKEILIKSVATALPTYSMSIFLLPSGFCKDLCKILRHFWWKDNRRTFYSDLGRTIDTLCCHKETCGKKTKYVNQAVLEYMKLYPIKSLTADNGKEFLSLSKIEGLDVYFAQAYSSYERQ